MLVALPPHDPQPFETLDHDWALICHQHRRSRTVAAWADQEPTLTGIRRLADVVPPPGADRAAVTAAVARLHAAGDDLAARTLLQLLVPGLIRLTATWRDHYPGGVAEAGWEIVGLASVYIARLRDGSVGCAPAGYVLRSIQRDLTREAQARQHHDDTHIDLEPVAEAHHGDRLQVPSAEDTVCAGIDVRLAIEAVARAGVIPPDAVELLWLVLTGDSVDTAAARTGHPHTTAYRYRDNAFAYLRRHRHLFATDTEAQR